MDAGAPAWERQFLSTPSVRRATEKIKIYRSTSRISIHALREEGDRMLPRTSLTIAYFYPRPP